MKTDDVLSKIEFQDMRGSKHTLGWHKLPNPKLMFKNCWIEAYFDA